jgi:hypothetical protein
VADPDRGPLQLALPEYLPVPLTLRLECTAAERETRLRHGCKEGRLVAMLADMRAGQIEEQYSRFPSHRIQNDRAVPYADGSSNRFDHPRWPGHGKRPNSRDGARVLPPHSDRCLVGSEQLATWAQPTAGLVRRTARTSRGLARRDGLTSGWAVPACTGLLCGALVAAAR